MIRNSFVNDIRCIAALLGVALVMAGCQRDGLAGGEDFGDGLIRYSVSVAGGVKGALINTSGDDNQPLPADSSFFVSAYKGSDALFENQKATSNGSGFWTNDNPQYWPLSTKLAFFAYANTPSLTVKMNAERTADTLTYTVPADASEHQDILLGYYYGNGGSKGIAEIRFGHPLTAVLFKEGSVAGNISSITLSGLASGGSVTMTAAGIGDWTVATGEQYKKSVTLSGGDAPLAVDATSMVIGKANGAFLLVPQKLAASEGGHPVTVTVALTTTGGDVVSVTADISSGEWKVGKTNTYTLNYGDVTNFALTVTPWDEKLSEMPLEKDIDGVQIGNVVWATENLAITESGKREYNGTGHVIGDYFQWAASYNGYKLDPATSSLTDLLIYSSFTNTLCGDEKDEFAFTNSRVFQKSYAPYNSTSTGYTKYTYSEVLTESDDIASIALGGLWRMPTIEEFQSLYDNYYWAYDETDKGFYVFNPDATHAAKSQSKTMPADLDKSQALLFFPVGGVGGTSDHRGKLAAAGESARYWSNTHDPHLSAGDFLRISDRVISNPLVKVEKGKNYYTYIERFFGAFIRPVKSLPVFYTITANVAAGCEDMGYVSGGDIYPAGTSVTLKAVPKPGYHFVRWNDGDTTQPRTITVSADATYTATFEMDNN